MEESINGKIDETEKGKDEKLDVKEGEEGGSVRAILTEENSESVKESHEKKETCEMQDLEESESEKDIVEPPMDCDAIETESEDGMLNGAMESSMWPQIQSTEDANSPKEEQSRYEAEATESSELIVDQTSMDSKEKKVESGLDVGQEDGRRASSIWPVNGRLSESEDKNSPGSVIKEEQSAYTVEAMESNDLIVEASLSSNVIELESDGIDAGQEDGARESSMWPVNLGESEAVEGLSETTEDKNSACSIIESTAAEEDVAVCSLVLPADATADKKSNENIHNNSSKPLNSANAIIVGSSDSFPQTTPNPHVISITRRTSWRSCCGLLQVLTRSNS